VPSPPGAGYCTLPCLAMLLSGNALLTGTRAGRIRDRGELHRWSSRARDRTVSGVTDDQNAEGVE